MLRRAERGGCAHSSRSAQLCGAQEGSAETLCADQNPNQSTVNLLLCRNSSVFFVPVQNESCDKKKLTNTPASDETPPSPNLANKGGMVFSLKKKKERKENTSATSEF